MNATPTPELWQRLKVLFEAALELPPERRAGFVQELGGADTLLREDLKALLKAHEEQSDWMDQPLVGRLDPDEAKDSLLAPGRVLLGRFEVVRHLGSGGMGDVYEAIDRDLGPGHGRIALKTVRRAIAENSAALARFKEEVVLARRVSGPHVCRIHELFVPVDTEAAGCCAFLTMEYLEGTTLADRLASLAETTGGALTLKDASAIAVQLCEALESIHQAGVIHRDLKPRNIMLCRSTGQSGLDSAGKDGAEKVVVTDFGLARVRARESANAETGLTRPGAVMGTPEYMAPEQLEGREASAATDIYALGLVLYEMVTGRQAFAASTPLGAAMRRAQRPTLASSLRREVPAAWDDVIRCCLEYEPERRFQSAREVMEELRKRRLVVWRFEQGQRIAVTPRGTMVAGALLVLLLAGTGWRWYRNSRYKPPPELALRWYERGRAALRQGSYLEATHALEQAIQVDSNFAMAHAGLAEALGELDFAQSAQREMLLASAPEQVRDLPELDRRYIEAVRRTLVRDYSAAAQNYEEILNALPEEPAERREAAYVDLGRAYERAGKVAETLAKYEQAARMTPDDPAPFLRMGILKSRTRDMVGAEADFETAEKIYAASSNREGEAEVAYQRGYAANEAAESEKAKTYLNESLKLAKEIGSVQLEARSLSQLSSLAYNDSHDDEAIADANQAIQLARDNGLEYWSTDGLMRLGNAYLDKEDFATAENYLQQSLRLATDNQHPRIEAAANLSLASLRGQQGKVEDEIRYAKAALPYYKDYGFMNAAAAAETLAVRGERSKGDLAAALADANALLALAQKTDSVLWEQRAEELIGSIDFEMDEFPSALKHFEKAFEASQQLHDSDPFQQVHKAYALVRLGRFADAKAALDMVAPEARKRNDLGEAAAHLRAQMELASDDPQGSLATVRQALASFPGIHTRIALELKEFEAVTEAESGQIGSAQKHVALMETLAEQDGGKQTVADARLAAAQVALLAKTPQLAISFIEAARPDFVTANRRDSIWRSLYVEAEARRAAGDVKGSADAAQKALDILDGIKQSWGDSAFNFYSSRPDYQRAMRELSKLRAT
jgi:tetratricopeptide (TPR) repeat protein